MSNATNYASDSGAGRRELFQRYKVQQAEVERLQLAWDGEIQIGVQFEKQLNNAREAARWLYRWIDENEWVHFSGEDVEVLKQWPWLWEVEDE